MPVKRRASKGKQGFDYGVAVHLACGDCLLAGPADGCGCGMVNEAGVFRQDLARLFRREYAAEIAAIAAGAREAEFAKLVRGTVE